MQLWLLDHMLTLGRQRCPEVTAPSPHLLAPPLETGLRAFTHKALLSAGPQDTWGRSRSGRLQVGIGRERLAVCPEDQMLE